MAEPVSIIAEETVVDITVGLQGPTGVTGATGAAGADGADGADGAAGADGADGVGVRTGTTVITGTSTATIDYSTGAAIYTFAKTVPVTLALSNLPAGAWGVILEITDDGGGDTVSYPANWKEVGGAAMSVTTSGLDRWLITGNGATDTEIRVSQSLDWRAV